MDGATGSDYDWQSDDHLSEQDQEEHSGDVFEDANNSTVNDAQKDLVKHLTENLDKKNSALRKDSVASDESIDQIELGELWEVNPCFILCALSICSCIFRVIDKKFLFCLGDGFSYFCTGVSLKIVLKITNQPLNT